MDRQPARGAARARRARAANPDDLVLDGPDLSNVSARLPPVQAHVRFGSRLSKSLLSTASAVRQRVPQIQRLLRRQRRRPAGTQTLDEMNLRNEAALITR